MFALHDIPELHHTTLQTTFRGIVHPISSLDDTPVYQFRGIKYASVPARFRQSKLYTSYPPFVDSTKYGPICPQVKSAHSIEETLFAYAKDDPDLPKQSLKQNEFECLNLNITCPAGLTPQSRLPVMVWVHGGGDRGSGSHWLYDGGALVRKSILMGTPVILVTFNFRIGLFGFAAGPMLREDNKMHGDEGVGNYGLRDQRSALEWIHHFIGDFGGDPLNVTFCGHSTGASDIVSHLLSSENERRPLFHRAIIQSPILEPTLPDVPNAGAHLSRLISALHVSHVDQLRCIDADKLVPFGQTIRAVDDGVFFRPGWKQYFVPQDHHHAHHHAEAKRSPSASRLPRRTARSTSRAPRLSGAPLIQLPPNLQPLIIGDTPADSLLWSLPISHWTSHGVTRRLKAICQSLIKASQLLQAYDISSYTPEEDISEHLHELVNDARIAWPIECVSQNAKLERGGRGVWRYVFDQEGPTRGIPHHAVDLAYLFDTAPLPPSVRPPSTEAKTSTPSSPAPFYGYGSDDEDLIIGSDSDEEWAVPSVDEWSYARVRDTMQERWISFANGDVPWNEDKVYVFGPEGETGERSTWIFEGRRRKHVWKEVLEPLGMQIVHKVGVELSRGPPLR